MSHREEVKGRGSAELTGEAAIESAEQQDHQWWHLAA